MSDPLFFDEKSSHNKGLREKISSLNPHIISILSVGTIVIIAMSIWAFYPGSPVTEDSLPIIRASSEPVRIKPEDTELTDTANYNSSIYETFGQTTHAPRRIENLLKPQQNAEVPIEKEELFAGLKTDIDNRKSKVISITESPFATVTEPPDSAPPPSSSEMTDQRATIHDQEDQPIPAPGDKIAIEIPVPEQKASTSPENFAKPQVTAIKETEEKDVTIAATPSQMDKTEPAAGALARTPEIIAPKSSPGGTHYVQLASIKDSSKTMESWKELTQKYASLQNISFRTQRADIEGKGTFYRIQAGPLSKEQAQQLCDQIKAASGSCFVTSK